MRLVLCALALTAALAACGGASSPKAAATPATPTPAGCAYNAAVDRFNALPEAQRASGYVKWATARHLPTVAPVEGCVTLNP